MRVLILSSLFLFMIPGLAVSESVNNTYYVYGNESWPASCSSPITQGFSLLGSSNDPEKVFPGAHATYIITNYDDAAGTVSAPVYIDAVGLSDGSYPGGYSAAGVSGGRYFIDEPDKRFAKIGTGSTKGCIMFENKGEAGSIQIHAAAEGDMFPPAVSLDEAEEGSMAFRLSSVPNATTYFVDVATDPNFNSYLSGYENYNTGGQLRFTVSDLGTGIGYYVRARSGNGTATSVNSFATRADTPSSKPYHVYGVNSNVACWQSDWLADATYLGEGVGDQTFASSFPYYVIMNAKDFGVCRTAYSAFIDAVQWSNSDYVTGENVGLSSNSASLNGILGAPDSIYGIIGTYFDWRCSCGCVTLANTASSESIRVIPSLATGPDIPVAPQAFNGTGVTSKSFTANWGVVEGASTYLLTVSSKSDYSAILPDYNMRDVGAATTAVVEPLQPHTRYYYRVQSANALGASTPSASMAVMSVAAPQPVSGIMPLILNEN